MRHAIGSLNYHTVCRVALEYRTRFWEHLETPIYGSCSDVAGIPEIGKICYPSYNINGVPEEQHARYAMETLVEIHGEVARDQYTGNFKRKCWGLDEFAGAAYASPTVGSFELYLPQYFKTHKHMVFVGEHTTYMYSWIVSAVESGIRGAVQLLLELGLVDEAKEAANKWMGRWLSVV
ncbi:hypothetical protein JDV02_004058 [Purpureocillium takamizusanense]|uniref:Amine oxidase domain-containing protein n=1 Tax=Purpureocillium takamizusanense TaxID=2060973 RepID=A0A9Q8VAE6_9HYPO|nr:uncharacterized protein JDV02_004058 [Purpureocillium takamizusanense]UNI17736.1 hypothetical protein JDV02_004058 [Purpureocillium takamizusanense]